MQLATLEDRRLPTAGRPSCAGSRENTPAPISYDLWRSRCNAFPHDLEQLIDEHAIRSICELGGGANPVLTPERLAQRRLDYLLVDIDPRELAKAPAGYATLEADVCSPPRRWPGDSTWSCRGCCWSTCPTANGFIGACWRCSALAGWRSISFPPSMPCRSWPTG